MGSTLTCGTLDDTLERLVTEAVGRDVSAEVANKARAATARAFTGLKEGSRGLQRRAEAYFDSVVRREVVLRRGCAIASARLIAATVAEDMARTGRAPWDIWDELQRGWAHAIPPEVLEEYRPVSAERVAA